MSKNKSESNSGTNETVAYHKVKRKFVSMKDMQLEDADQFLMCEFKGYNFEIVD